MRQGPLALYMLVRLQVRSFAKEEQCCERYEAAQTKVLGWGLKSAVASAFFFAWNFFFATGAIVVILW